MAGFPVVLSDRGAPFVAVEKGAPLATVAENGRGLPIRVVEKGAPPLVIHGLWSPADLFADGEFGTWYDPSFLDTLFQDANGTTPAVPGSPVGLVLDAREELGPELVTNGDFSDELDGFTVFNSGTASTAVEGGWAVLDNSAGDGLALVIQAISGLNVNSYYQLKVDEDFISGSDQYQIGMSTNGTNANIQLFLTVDGNGVKSLIFKPTLTTMWFKTRGSSLGSKYRIRNISIREVLNPPLSQPTTAARPILARMPKTGRRNLLTSTEDFSNSAWVKTNVTVSDAGGGRWKITPNNGDFSAGDSGIYQLGDALPDIKQSVSFYAEADGTDYLHVVVGRQPNRYFSCSIDLTDGSHSQLGDETTVASVIPYGLGWLVECTSTIPSGTLGSWLTFRASTEPMAAGYSPDVKGNGVSGVIIGFPQREVGEPTPYQRVRSAFDITEEGVPDAYNLVYDLADDALTTTLPQAVNGDLLIAGTNGSIIEPVSYAAGSTFTIGPDTYTGGTPGIMRAIGDIVGVMLIDRTLSQTERENLLRHYKGKGAKGLLVPGPELVVNGDFSDGANGWELGPNWSIADGTAVCTGSTGGSINAITSPDSLAAGKLYLVSLEIISATGTVTVPMSRTTPISLPMGPSSGIYSQVRVKSTAGSGSFGINAPVGVSCVVDNVSLRELRPQEDWT